MFCLFVCISWLQLKGFNYTLVGVNEDELKDALKNGIPNPIYWAHETELQRLDHLYIVHYPDPEKKGDYCRYFGGDVIEDTKGSCHTPH